MSEATDGSERRYHPTDGTRTKFGARLKDEGRLDAFNVRVAELKAPTTTKPERQQAFWQAVHEFAPADETEPSPRPSAALVNAAAFASKDAVPSVKAISWVASVVAVDGVGAGDAPDSASWALRCWVLADRGNEREFWRMLFPMVIRAERTDEPQWSPPDPEEHRTVLAKINAITDDVYGRHAAGLARRFIEQPDLWETVKPFVEDALNNRRKHAAALGSIIRNIPRQRLSESEDAMLAEVELWVAAEPSRRWRMLRDHLRPLLMGGRRKETPPQLTELESA